VQVDAAVALARDRGADHVDDPDDPAALALQLLHRGERVDRLAGLADRDVEGVGLHHRVAVAELRRGLRAGRHPREVLDQLGSQLTGVARRAAAEDLHALDLARLADRQVEAAEVRGLEPVVDAPAQCALDGPRLLGDLLDQEVGVVADLGADDVPVDGGRALRRGPVVQGVRAVAVRRDRGELAVVEVDDLAGVADQGRHVGGDEHLLLADAQQHRAAVAGDDDLVRVLGVEDGEAVGADDLPERLPDGLLKVARTSRERRRDEVRDGLGVGLRGELDTIGGQLGAQLVGVLDDPVVHHGDTARGVGVRVRVLRRRLTVGGPAGVPDAGRATEAGRQVGGEVRDAAAHLADLEPAPHPHGDARRVVAPVLETAETLEQDRGRVLWPHVTDDAAHVSLSS
jgi:hypothetical protein